MTMKTIIYLRTSTEEQNPENQLKDCKSLLKDNNFEVLQEKQSAFKNESKREIFNSIINEIKKSKVENLIVWDLDRIYRNRVKLKQFFELCKIYKCKVHSFRQGWLEELNNIPEPFNEIMHSLMLQIMGWLAEEESRKKSERVKLAVRKVGGITKSYKGNKWGRKSMKKNIDKQIIELKKKGKTMREICKEVYYWDGNNHKKFISIGYVHKLLKNNEQITS